MVSTHRWRKSWSSELPCEALTEAESKALDFFPPTPYMSCLVLLTVVTAGCHRSTAVEMLEAKKAKQKSTQRGRYSQ